VVGRRDAVAQLARHPLARALRPDKVTLAALEAVALAYLRGDGASIPLWRLATTAVDELRERARAIAATVPGATAVGTEAVPGRTIPSAGVALAVDDVDAALARLRGARVVALGRDGAVVCDLRTVEAELDERVGAALRAASQ